MPDLIDCSEMGDRCPLESGTRNLFELTRKLTARNVELVAENARLIAGFNAERERANRLQDLLDAMDAADKAAGRNDAPAR